MRCRAIRVCGSVLAGFFHVVSISAVSASCMLTSAYLGSMHRFPRFDNTVTAIRWAAFWALAPCPMRYRRWHARVWLCLWAVGGRLSRSMGIWHMPEVQHRQICCMGSGFGPTPSATLRGGGRFAHKMHFRLRLRAWRYANTVAAPRPGCRPRSQLQASHEASQSDAQQ